MKKQSGFTLIELMVVIVIMGILVLIGVGSFVSSQKKGRDARRKADVTSIARALETYYNDFGKYPSADASGNPLACGAGGVAACTWGQKFSNTLTSPETIYMAKLPKDPKGERKYYYSGSGNTYKLYAWIENTDDAGEGVNQAGYAGTNCASSGNALCTYGTSSSNTTP